MMAYRSGDHAIVIPLDDERSVQTVAGRWAVLEQILRQLFVLTQCQSLARVAENLWPIGRRYLKAHADLTGDRHKNEALLAALDVAHCFVGAASGK